MIKNEHAACSGRSRVWCHERNVGLFVHFIDGAVLRKDTFEMSVNFRIEERKETGRDDNSK